MGERAAALIFARRHGSPAELDEARDRYLAELEARARAVTARSRQPRNNDMRTGDDEYLPRIVANLPRIVALRVRFDELFEENADDGPRELTPDEGRALAEYFRLRADLELENRALLIELADASIAVEERPVPAPRIGPCATCEDMLVVPAFFTLPSGARAARFDDCPVCVAPRDPDPR